MRIPISEESLHGFLLSFAFQNDVSKLQQEIMNLKKRFLQEKVRKKYLNMPLRLIQVA